MRLFGSRLPLAALGTALLFLVSVKPASAADPVSIEIRAPKQVDLGDDIRVTAELRDAAGTPVPAARITFWSGGSFLSVGGAVELADAITDARGNAEFAYQARTEKSITLTATFLGDSRFSFAQASTDVEVLGSAQLYQSEAGVRVAGIGVWLLAGIVGGVWATYFAVMVFLMFIAREGVSRRSSTGAAPDA